MKVTVAGFNVDAELLDQLAGRRRVLLTPETISAAYARISRSARPVGHLRRIAREEVEKARRSNRTIIFQMGHHSVAEHAVFNFDLVGVSRLAVEAVEHFRLNAYTEKSQRYVKLERDHVLPAEIRAARLGDRFQHTVRIQNDFYHRAYARLRAGVPAGPECRPDVGRAREDARYVAALATQTQLGMTVNARNLELMIRRFAASDLDEVRRLGRRLFLHARRVAPSVVLFCEPTAYDRDTATALAARAFPRGVGAGRPGPAVRLVAAPVDGDERVLAALLTAVSRRSHDFCRHAVQRMTRDQRRALVMEALARMELYDPAPREFEHVSLTFELVMSASCFAQFKRHRLATLSVQDYDPGLGVTVPGSLIAAGLQREFQSVVGRTEETFDRLRPVVGRAAQYVLTNAHRRRVLVTGNAREFYHISRLREDAEAQWEIRALAAEMSRFAQQALPLTFLLLGGKDRYPARYAAVFGHPPRVAAPELPGARPIGARSSTRAGGARRNPQELNGPSRSRPGPWSAVVRRRR